jgi:nucleoside-diphosphate kinase
MIERTLILVKHDGVLRGLVGEIIRRFENIGLKIVGLKMVWADQKMAQNHYVVTDEWANDVFNKAKSAAEKSNRDFPYNDAKVYASNIQKKNTDFLTEGPVVAIVFEGHHSVELGRKIVGSTEPRQALPGTIRGDFMHDSYKVADGKERSVRNLVHASGTLEEAFREIPLWFSDKELHSYKKELDKHHY